jgi:hypothetical protein
LGEDAELVRFLARADFYDRPPLYLPTSELFSRRTEPVGPLAPDELHQALVGPAERHGLELERGLAAAILRDAERLSFEPQRSQRTPSFDYPAL